MEIRVGMGNSWLGGSRRNVEQDQRGQQNSSFKIHNSSFLIHNFSLFLIQNSSFLFTAHKQTHQHALQKILLVFHTKTDGIHAKTDGFHTKTDGIHTKTDEFHTKTDEFPCFKVEYLTGWASGLRDKKGVSIM